LLKDIILNLLKNDDSIIKRLNELYNKGNGIGIYVKKLPLNVNDKYAIFSDLHLGNGRKADNFIHNKETILFSLNYYKNNGYSIILLGDIEELWQFDFTEIHNKYNKSVYKLLRSFPKEKIHRLFGNHDKDWQRPADPTIFNENTPCETPEAIILGDDIFLVHGHQGDYLCDKTIWSSRFLSRILRPLVPIGKIFGYENRSAPKSQIPKNREKLYYNWAKENKIFLICGHTHNAIFASRSYYWWLKDQIKQKEDEREQNLNDKAKYIKLTNYIKKLKRELHIEKNKGRNFSRLTTVEKPLPCYFNTGCGLYRKGITNIEIEGVKVRLIKWDSNNSLPLEKRRIKLWKEESLSELRKQKCKMHKVPNSNVS
jgi:predicted phosphodiesterase